MARSLTLIVLVASVALACTQEPPRAPNEDAEATVTYEVAPPTIPKGTTPRATITNEGPASIEYGNLYRLERMEDGYWAVVEQPDNAEIMCGFTLEAYVLAPGDSKAQSIEVCDRRGEPMILQPGRYRLFKTVCVIDPTDRTICEDLKVRTDFEIIDH